MTFKLRMEESAKKAGSNIVLALDLPIDEPRRLLSKSIGLLRDVAPYVCAVKLNHQLTLPLGLFNGIQKIVGLAHGLNLPIIMDCKANDVEHTNRLIAEYYYRAGFDAITANPFVGWEEGLQPVFELAQQTDRGVILLVYMSHRGAEEGYGQVVRDIGSGALVPQYVVFARKALEWKADGVIVGATYPEKIREISAILENRVPIYSPGIGAQGGKIELATKAGAHYLIVGRSLTLSKNPAEDAKYVRDIAKQCSKSGQF